MYKKKPILFLYKEVSFNLIDKYNFKDKNDIQKIYIGLKWLHHYIKHSPKDNIDIAVSAIDIFNASVHKNAKLNCRNMAVVLNAIYLSLGLKSRYIICLQKEIIINNSHFVVEVYVKELQKWIIVDPSYALLFLNKEKKHLSLAEVRFYIATGKKIEIKTICNKLNSYLYWHNYISKLYRFRRPIVSNDKYDINSKFIELIPKIKTNSDKELELIDNPMVFWTS